MDGHPVRLVVEDDLRRSRLTVFFRLLLALPHILWFVVWSVAVFFIGVVGWICALVLGRLPTSLHRFLAAYMRYATHLFGYLTISANPYPGFDGAPGYPIDLVLPTEPEQQARWTIALRLVLALPALVLAATLGSGFGGGGGGRSYDSETGGGGGATFVSAAALCAFLGWFAALATGRMPLGLRNLASYGVGYTSQSYSYLLLLTDRYPNTDPERLGPAWELPPHPVQLELTDDGRRSRLTVLFRLLLALPHIVWLILWTMLAFLAAIVNGLITLFRGRSAGPLHRFLAAYIRYYTHVSAFLFLVANPFPGFVGTPGYPVEVSLGEPERQNRWITFFRFPLAFPAFFIAGALSAVLFVASIFGWFAALVTGRMPIGLRNVGAVCVRYFAQVNAYFLVVTDSYPHSTPAVRPPPEPEPEPELLPWPDPEVVV